MDNTQSRNETLVFGLDIGTRSIVGVVGYMERNRFKVIAMAEQKHETRAMLDGQIHDIYKVGDTIRKVKNSLENQLERELSDVCIAAAGRVLKTVNSSADMNLKKKHGLHRNISIHLIFWQLRMHIIRLTKKKIKQDFIASETPL